MFSRMHVLVIGPGLGRKPEVVEATKQIIQRAKEENLPLVIDADGLFLISQEPDLIYNAQNIVSVRLLKFHIPRTCEFMATPKVITPNPVELKRIADTLQLEILPDEEVCEGAKQKDLSNAGMRSLSYPPWFCPYFVRLPPHRFHMSERLVVDLSRRLGGVTVLRKGRHDIISDGSEVLVSLEDGSPRRSGGQGDILAGVAAVTRAWLETYKVGKHLLVFAITFMLCSLNCLIPILSSGRYSDRWRRCTRAIGGQYPTGNHNNHKLTCVTKEKKGCSDISILYN